MALDSKEQARLWAKVVAKAWADEAYKKKLTSDPQAVLKAEGLNVPDGVNLAVLEDTASVKHLVLPAMPADAAGLDHATLSERLAAADVCGY